MLCSGISYRIYQYELRSPEGLSEVTEHSRKSCNDGRRGAVRIIHFHDSEVQSTKQPDCFAHFRCVCCCCVDGMWWGIYTNVIFIWAKKSQKSTFYR